MSNRLKLGIAGLGTVGIGVLKILGGNSDTLSARAGLGFEVCGISARDRHRDRGLDISTYEWFDNPVDLVEAGADAIVELIGGSDGPALALARAALSNGVHFITANKALIAHHGAELAILAEENGAALRFEAAVAGGIPIIKAIREGLAANQISRVSGILNGTCNYILTVMETDGRDFADVLEEAQKLGYAEADPTFDIDGIDAGHKTAILAALAFGAGVRFDALSMEGIRHISKVDIEYATELGYRIKLLGVAEYTENGLEQRVHPCMVKLGSPLAQVDGSFNAVEVHGDFIGRTFYEGPGAGEGPTASAVVADLVDIARGDLSPAFGVPATELSDVEVIDDATHEGHFYIRLRVQDIPGVIADVSGVLRAEDVSVESLIQHGSANNGGVNLVLTTHQVAEGRIQAVMEAISKLPCILEPPAMIRIEYS